MYNRMKNAVCVGILLLLISACGQVESTPAPEPVVEATESAVDVPSAVPAEGLAPETLSQYVGLKYPPIPAGLSENFAMLIQGSEDHSLSLISDGQNTMLWLSKMTDRDASGNPIWEVKDILDLSEVESGLSLLPDGCLLNSVPDSEILVVGRDDIVQLAWRANTALGVFQVIPIDGIECQSDKAWTLE